MEHISDTVLGLTGLLALAVLLLPVAGRLNFPYTGVAPVSWTVTELRNVGGLWCFLS